MAIIAELTRTEAGFSRQIHTLVLDRTIVMLPAENPNSGSGTDYPDYRIHLGDDHGPDIGAAWKRTGEQAGTGYNILLDDPSFAQPVRSRMFQTDEQGDGWAMRWFRPKKQDEQD
jgi:uncharacterized protein (DUF736 family)